MFQAYDTTFNNSHWGLNFETELINETILVLEEIPENTETELTEDRYIPWELQSEIGGLEGESFDKKHVEG